MNNTTLISKLWLLAGLCCIFFQCGNIDDSSSETNTSSAPAVEEASIEWPSTDEWKTVVLDGIEMTVPPNWKAEFNEFTGTTVEIYPGKQYEFENDKKAEEMMKMFGYTGTIEEFKNDDEYKEYISVNMEDQKRWIMTARTDITWHVEEDSFVYFEAMDGGEKTHSCYGTKDIDGVNYYFNFDGLSYDENAKLTRLTQEDCLNAIQVFKSMKKAS